MAFFIGMKDIELGECETKALVSFTKYHGFFILFKVFIRLGN